MRWLATPLNLMLDSGLLPPLFYELHIVRKAEPRAGGTTSKTLSRSREIEAVKLAASRQRRHPETHLYGTTTTLALDRDMDSSSTEYYRVDKRDLEYQSGRTLFLGTIPNPARQYLGDVTLDSSRVTSSVV